MPPFGGRVRGVVQLKKEKSTHRHMYFFWWSNTTTSASSEANAKPELNAKYGSQNHRMVWVGRDLTDHLVQTLTPRARTPSTRPGCSMPHPTRP